MSRTLVFCHAHPDDEALLTSGTMARATAEGNRVVLIVTTNGEAGLTDAALTANLGARRLNELDVSAATLGVARVVSLGYGDSGLHAEHNGLAHVDSTVVAREIAKVLDDENADVVTGYDPSGGYGHPDHLAVHRAVRLATNLAHRRPRLYEATLPREPIAAIGRWAARTHIAPGSVAEEFAQAWTPRAEITHRVDVRPYLTQKRASLAAHASQATADGSTRTLGVLRRLPSPVFRALLGTEYYVQIDKA